MVLLRRLATWFQARPSVALTAAFVSVCLYFARDFGWLWAVVLVLPLGLAGAGLFHWLGRVMSARLARPEFSPWPEVLAAVPVCLGLIVLMWRGAGLWLATVPLVAQVWIFWAARARRVGALFAVLVGVFFFALAVLARAALAYEATLAQYIQYQWRAEPPAAALRWTQATGADGETEGTFHRLSLGEREVLSVFVPEGLVFHDARRTAFLVGVPTPGTAICYVSDSGPDPFSLPALGVFRVSAAMGVRAPEDLRGVLERSLALRKNAGEVTALRYAGPWTLSLGADRRPGFDPVGVYFEYHDRTYDETVRLGLFLSYPAPSGERFALLVQDAPPGGLPLDPRLLAALRQLRFSPL